jgi:hypothetical protein
MRHDSRASALRCRAMSRLLCIFLNAATVLSLLLCVATGLLWMRSYFITDQIEHNPLTPKGMLVFDQTRLISARGRLLCMWSRQSARPPVSATTLQTWRDEWLQPYLRSPRPGSWRTDRAIWNWDHGPHPRVVDPPRYLRGSDWQMLGLGTGSERGTGFGSHGPVFGEHTFWLLPYGLVFGLAALLPIGRLLMARLRRRRISANLCRSCGYDLRATPDRCPECGTIPS